MKNLLLRRDVYACRTDDGTVLADLRAGKYFGLDRETTMVIAPRVQGWVAVIEHNDSDVSPDLKRSEKILSTLINDLELLTDSSEIGKPLHFPVLLQTESIPFRGNILPWPRITYRHGYALCVACLRALLDLKFRPISAAVRRVEARKLRHAGASISRAQTVELVRIFRALRPFLYTTKDHCLFDSLALIEFLARFGAFPTWVIGVRTRPFAAHSWVVDGSLILNELLEKAEDFSPILAI